ncbi:hypothetical protein GCM10010293_45990 [Streptomyces griseoflavus]|nr:hypothetical protein GCM10010293_45990 [Streptomyces griseoflavus]
MPGELAAVTAEAELLPRGGQYQDADRGILVVEDGEEVVQHGVADSVALLRKVQFDGEQRTLPVGAQGLEYAVDGEAGERLGVHVVTFSEVMRRKTSRELS